MRNRYLDAATGQTYQLFKVYTAAGTFTDRTNGRRYNLVKRAG